MSQKSEAFHVHLGSGALGLGFVAHLSHHAGLTVFLANRSNSRTKRAQKRNEALKAATEYSVAIDDIAQTTAPHLVSLEAVFLLEEDLSALVRTIRDRRTMLLTTALTYEGLEKSVPLLRELLSERLDAGIDHPLFLIACENRLGPTYLALKRDFDSEKLPFLECIVDRICREPSLDPNSGSVTVHVERRSSWIIEQRSSSDALDEILAPLGEFDIIGRARDLHPFKTRKRWLVNGVHLAVAILAKREREVHIDRFLANEDAQALVRQVQDELADAVDARSASGIIFLDDEARLDPTFSVADLREFNESVLHRFAGYPDRVERVLRRFRKSTLPGFMEDTYEKLVDPARTVFSLDQEHPTALVNILHDCWQLVRDRDYIGRSGLPR